MAHPRELIKRLGIAGILVALVFFVRLIYQASGPGSSHWKYFTGAYLVLLAFTGYQVLRAAALIAVSRGTTSPLLGALHLRGIRGTLWEIFRRRLAPGLRLPLIFAVCTLFILGTVLVLWRTHSLESLQARMVSRLAWGNDSSGVPICRIVALETPDNNLGRYYRAVGTVARNLRDAGARIVIAERSRDGGPLSPWNPILDSLERIGVCLYESGKGVAQSLPLPTPPSGDWSHARIMDQARPVPEEGPSMIAFRPVPSWYNQHLHCALRVIALMRGQPGSRQPVYADGEIRFGDLRIPVTGEGEAFAPVDARIFWKGLAGYAVLQEGTDSLSYWDDSRIPSPALSPLLAARVRGEVVFIPWFESGGFEGDLRTRRAAALPSIIEALQRGRLLTPLPFWGHLVTLFVLLLGMGLSLGKHLRVAFPAMLCVAVAILAADVWLTVSLSLLAGLIYPAVAAVLSGILFPLATHFHRHP